MNKTFKSANCVFAKIRCIVLFLMMFPLGALAQNVNISGTVTDANTGEEVIGATVKVKVPLAVLLQTPWVITRCRCGRVLPSKSRM